MSARRWLLLAVATACAALLGGCGRAALVAQHLVEIDHAAQAQLAGVPARLPAAAIRGHALTALAALGVELTPEEQRWIAQHQP